MSWGGFYLGSRALIFKVEDSSSGVSHSSKSPAFSEIGFYFRFWLRE